MITLKIHVLYYVHYVHGAGAGASGTLLPSHRFLRGSWNRSHLLKAPQFLFCERCCGWEGAGGDGGGGDPAAAAKGKRCLICPGGLCCPRGAAELWRGWAALASRVRECHDAGGAMEPLPTGTSCWSDQQMAFAYVKNIHRSRLSYSPRQHLRLPGAAARAGLAAKPLGAAGSAAGHRGDPDTCAGAGP